MSKLNFQDNLFLISENGSKMHHISGAFIFKKPENAPKDFVLKIYEQLRNEKNIQKKYRSKLKYPQPSLNQEWIDDEHFDIDFHLRHYALGFPGSTEQLMALINTLHGQRMDTHRPLWEYHFIDGLEEDRFVVFSRQHHAMIDGRAAMDLLDNFFSTSSKDSIPSAPWSEELTGKKPKKEKEKEQDSHPRGFFSSKLSALETTLRSNWKAASSTTDLTKLMIHQFEKFYEGNYNTTRLLLSAPKSIFNGVLGLKRQTLSLDIPLAELKVIGKHYDASINDVFLALSGEMLRLYMQENNAVVDENLIAMVPVSLKTRELKGGNQLAVIHCPLQTTIENSEERLLNIKRSMDEEKKQFKELRSETAKAYTNIMSLPSLAMLMTGMASKIRPTYNVTVSNVSGPSDARYLNGAKLENFIPMSVITEGSTLNITGISYDGKLQVSLLVCPDSIPNSDQLLAYLSEALSNIKSMIK